MTHNTHIVTILSGLSGGYVARVEFEVKDFKRVTALLKKAGFKLDIRENKK